MPAEIPGPGRYNICREISVVTLNIALAQINLMVGDITGNARRVVETAPDLIPKSY